MKLLVLKLVVGICLTFVVGCGEKPRAREERHASELVAESQEADSNSGSDAASHAPPDAERSDFRSPNYSRRTRSRSSSTSDNGFELHVQPGHAPSVQAWIDDVKRQEHFKRTAGDVRNKRTQIKDGSTNVSVLQPRLAVQFRHAKLVEVVDFSPDDRLVLTSDPESTLIWDAATGMSVRQLPGRLGTFSPLGNSVVTVIADCQKPYCSAVLWDLIDGQEICRFDGHTDPIESVAISPNGQFLLTGSEDASARLWNVKNGQEIRRFDGHSLMVYSVAFSPNGRFVLTRSGDDTSRLWDVTTGHEIQRFEKQSGYIGVPDPRGIRFRYHSIPHFSPDSKFVLTARAENTSRLWDIRLGKEVRRFDGPSAGFSPDGRFVITLLRDGTVRLWDVNTGKIIGTAGNIKVSLDAHKPLAVSSNGRTVFSLRSGAVFRHAIGAEASYLSPFGDHNASAVFVSPKGRYLVTTSVDFSVVIRDLSNINRIHKLCPIEDRIHSLNFNADDQYVVIGRDSGTQVWDTQIGGAVRHYGGSDTSISPDGKLVLVKSRTRCRVIDFVTGRQICELIGKLGQDAIAPDSQTALLINGKTVRLCNLVSGTEIRRFDGHSAIVVSAAFSRDGRFVLTESLDQTARLWEVETGKERQRFERKGRRNSTAAVSPDGRLMLTITDEHPRGAKLLDTTTGRELRRFCVHERSIKSAIFSPDGHFVLTVSGGKTARLWKVDTAKEILRFEEHASSIDSVQFSPDSRFVVSETKINYPRRNARAARLWDVATGSEIRLSDGHSDTVSAVGFSRNGRFVLSGSDDGTVVLWQIDNRNVKLLCRLINHSDRSWVVVDGVGHFDLSDIENDLPWCWIFPDDPFRPLPPEMFFQNCYEPKLLARIIVDEEIQPITPLARVNRAHPIVKILSVESAPDADSAKVTVTVSGNTGEFQREGKTVTDKTGAFDLHLFRNNQLVAQWPDTRAYGPANGWDLKNAWQSTTSICAHDQTATKTFSIRLPRNRTEDEIEFSAYAFNRDRVKGPTARTLFKFRNRVKAVNRRAYLVSIGVNNFSVANWNLNFAAADARIIHRSLKPLFERQGYEVVTIPLISDGRHNSLEVLPTKQNIKTVFDILTGREVEVKHRGLLGQLGGQLRVITPDDIVVIFFSSHGYTSQDGTYYFFPCDIGQSQAIVADNLLQRCISSDELSHWVQSLDAAEFVLIVDTCHAAAMVDQPGFKPGPVSNRGLGQLAYNKGMRILCATQADNVAIESRKIKQGLLTYALTHDALEHRRAARNGIISLHDWLQFAESRVPQLYSEVLYGKVRDAVGNEVRHAVPIPPTQDRERTVQRPVLFDFRPERRTNLNLVGAAQGKLVRRFTGHTGPVTSVAFSPNSRIVVTGSGDHSVRLWDVVTGKEIRRIVLPRGDSPVPALGASPGQVAISPDNRFVLTGTTTSSFLVKVDFDGRLWDVTTGNQIRLFKGHTENVHLVAFSPDGSIVLTGSGDKTVRLWETDTGQQVRRFKYDGDSRISSVAFGPRGRVMITGHWDKIARLWSIASGEQIRQFEGHTERVEAVAISPDGMFVLTGSDDNTAKLWDIATGNEVRRFEAFDMTRITSVVFSHDGNWVLTGSRAHQHEASTLKNLSVRDRPGQPRSTSFQGNLARLWDVATGSEICRFEGHSDWISSVAFSPDGQFVLTGSHDGTARLWKINE